MSGKQYKAKRKMGTPKPRLLYEEFSAKQGYLVKFLHREKPAIYGLWQLS